MPQPPKTPDKPHPEPGHDPGYSEEHPRNPQEATQPFPKRSPNPDEGGLGRKPETMPEPGEKH